MASNGKEAEFHEGIKNNGSIANATPTLIVTKDADGTFEHATVADIPLSSASIAALALKAPINNPTFTNNLSLQANALNSSVNRLKQVMATNDVWSIYGEAAVIDQGILVFEVGDNAAPFSSNGQKIEFRYVSSTTPGDNKTPVTIDYNLTTVDSSLTLAASDASDNKLRVIDLTGTGDRMALIESDGTFKAGLAVPKVYNALLNQSALLAPVATVISNTLSGTPAWAYVSPGQYTLTLTNAFPLNKTLIFSLIGSGTAAGDTSIKCFRNTDSEIVLNTTFNAAFTNILLTNASFKIEVYP